MQQSFILGTKKLVIVLFLFFFSIANSQQNPGRAYLARKIEGVDTLINVPLTFAALIKGATANGIAWKVSPQFEKGQSDLFYFEMNELYGGLPNIDYHGSQLFMLAVKMPVTGNVLDFNKLDTVWTADFYNTHESWAGTADSTVGQLSMSVINGHIILDGIVYIGVKHLTIEERLVFEHFAVPVMTYEEYIGESEKIKNARNKQIDKIIANDVSGPDGRRDFLDSLSKLYECKNTLQFKDGNKAFDYTLYSSGAFINAQIDTSKKYLTDLMGNDPMNLTGSRFSVLEFHCLYNSGKPEDRTIYTLYVCVCDKLQPGKFLPDIKAPRRFVPLFTYWCFGDAYQLRASAEGEGDIIFLQTDDNKITGEMNLRILQTKGPTVFLQGHFELPKVNYTDVPR